MSENIIEAIANRTGSPKYNDAERLNLVTQCWDMLEDKVKTALSKQIEENSSGKISIDGTEKEGIAQFIESMKRLQNSFLPTDMHEAVSNFEAVDKSKYCSEPSLFNSSLVTELQKHPLIASAAAGVSTQLSTITTDVALDEDKANKVMANLLIGLVTNKSILHSRSADPTRIGTHGQIHPSLVIATAQYVKENFSSLENLSEKELRKVGGELKTACRDLALTPQNMHKGLLSQTKGVFKKLSSLTRARLAALSVAPSLEKMRSGSDAASTISTGSSHSRDGSVKTR